MKRIMSISGLVSALAITCGAVFKINHWPFAGILLALGTVLFAVVFLPLMSVLKLRESADRRHKLLIVLGVATGLFIVLGILFRIMHWPGAALLSRGSFAFLILVYVPVFFFTGRGTHANRLNTFVTSVLLLAGAGMLMSLSNPGFSSHLIRSLYAADEFIVTNTNLARQSNTFMLEQIKRHGEAEAGALKAREITLGLTEYLQEMKACIIAKAEGIHADKARRLNIKDMKFPEKNTGIYGPGGQLLNERFSNEALYAQLEKYNTGITGSFRQAGGLRALKIAEGEPGNTTAAVAIHEISQLEYQAAMNESMILSYISGKLVCQAKDNGSGTSE